jgi:hypothetical protein
MKIVKIENPKRNKKVNRIHHLEVTEKELIIIAALLGKATYGGRITTDMYKSLVVYYPEYCPIAGNTNLDRVVKFIDETYED